MEKSNSTSAILAEASAQISSLTDSNFRKEPDIWGTRLVSAGSLLTLLFQILYMAFDRQFLSINRPLILILHSLNIAVYGIAVATSSIILVPSMRRQWKAVAFTFSCIMIWSSTLITILTGRIEPFFFLIVLFLAGTGTFLSWGGRTQALLSLVAIAAFAIAIEKLRVELDPYQWLAILLSAAIGVYAAALLKGLRRASRQAETERVRFREMWVRQERLRLVGKLVSGIGHDLDSALKVAQLRLFALQCDQHVLDTHSELLTVVLSKLKDATLTVVRIRELSIMLDPGSVHI
jgi:hypothetical protein